MDGPLLWLLAADALLLLHAFFAAFVVIGLVLILFGGWRGWVWVRSPGFRLTHLAGVLFVTLQAWVGRVCPLTEWEMALRARAGDAVYEGSFVAHWLETLLYYRAPAWVFVVAYTLFAVGVVASWFLVRPRRFGRQR